MKALFTSHYRLLLATGAVLGALLAAAPAQAARFCDGKPATIQRGDGDNDITGTDGPDVIVAGAGDDEIFPGLGRDRVCGEAGTDAVYGDEGGDPFLSGGLGRDYVDGNEGNDTVAGGEGRDGGQTTWRGGQGFGARLEGGPGDDTVMGGPGSDGDGYGTFTYDGLVGGEGDDELFGGSGDDDLDDRHGPNNLRPADTDRVFGGDGDEEINVEDGDGLDAVDCGPFGDDYTVTTDPGDELNCGSPETSLSTPSASHRARTSPSPGLPAAVPLAASRELPGGGAPGPRSA
jgi:hypothetical protein